MITFSKGISGDFNIIERKENINKRKERIKVS